jgi:hypothetical protein
LQHALKTDYYCSTYKITKKANYRKGGKKEYKKRFYHQEDVASSQWCVDTLEREILFEQLCCFIQAVHNYFAPIHIADVVNVHNYFAPILEPDVGVSVGEK